MEKVYDEPKYGWFGQFLSNKNQDAFTR